MTKSVTRAYGGRMHIVCVMEEGHDDWALVDFAPDEPEAMASAKQIARRDEVTSVMVVTVNGGAK